MEGDLSANLAEMQQTWYALTGGGLACYIEDLEALRFDRKRQLPVAVRKAMDQGSPLQRYEHRKCWWWVVQPTQQHPVKIQFVAWGLPGEEASQRALLTTWIDALSFGIREKNLVGNLTEALVGAWDRLTFFYEFTQIASRVTALPELMRSIIDLLKEVIFVDDVFILLPENGEYRSVSASGQKLPDVDLLMSLVESSVGPMSLRDLQGTLTQAGSPLAECGDLLVSSLSVEGQVSGLIGFIDKIPGRFTANDAQLLAAAADRVCSIVESMRARIIREERQKIERELEVAARIQASLLPDVLPKIPGVDIAVYLQPAQHVGGDIYAVAESVGGDPLTILADVAGKGTPAAILTSIVHGTFRGHAPFCERPAELLEQIGQRIYQDLERADTFVTAIILRCLRQEGAFEYASAGHVDAILWRQKEQRVEFLPGTGIPLGIDPACAYKNQYIDFHPGDLLLVYSDGVTEAEDPDGKVLGLQGLSDIIYATNPARAADQIDTLRMGLEVHRRGLPSRDDVALLLFRGMHADDFKRKVVPFVIESDDRAVRRVVDLIRSIDSTELIHPIPLRQQILDDFALATSEIITNQIRHAFGDRGGRIQGRVVIEAERLVADLFDHGVPISVPITGERRIEGREPPERGYGLMLAEGLLDVCEYHRVEGKRNHWRLIKNLTGVDKDED